MNLFATADQKSYQGLHATNFGTYVTLVLVLDMVEKSKNEIKTH